MGRVFALVILFVGVVTLSFGQESSFGTGFPDTVKFEELDETFKPVQLGVSESNSWMKFMAMGMGIDSEQFGLVARAASVSWVSGASVEVFGNEMLVTYCFDLDWGFLLRGGESLSERGLWLKLRLVAKDAIITIEPIPGLTRDAFREMLSGFFGVPDKPVSDSALKAQGLSNMKQLVTGLAIYLADYDDLYPRVDSTPAFRSVVNPYTRSKGIFRSMNPNGRGEIFYNINVGGVLNYEIENIFDLVVLFDPTPWPDGRYLVGFADTSAKFVDSDEWERLRELMKQKLPKKGGVVRVPDRDLIRLPLPGTYDPDDTR